MGKSGYEEGKETTGAPTFLGGTGLTGGFQMECIEERGHLVRQLCQYTLGKGCSARLK